MVFIGFPLILQRFTLDKHVFLHTSNEIIGFSMNNDAFLYTSNEIIGFSMNNGAFLHTSNEIIGFSMNFVKFNRFLVWGAGFHYLIDS